MWQIRRNYQDFPVILKLYDTCTIDSMHPVLIEQNCTPRYMLMTVPSCEASSETGQKKPWIMRISEGSCMSYWLEIV